MTDDNQKVRSEIDGEIDLVELTLKLWNERRMILKWCGVGVLVALIVAFSIPKEYSTTVKLAPEVADGKSISGSLGALASMAGINMGSGGGADAVYPELYPDVVKSVPFVVALFDVKLTDKKGELHVTLYDYVTEELRSPWWSAVTSAPFRLLGWFMSLFRDEDPMTDGRIDPFRLSVQQAKAVEVLQKRIGVSVDRKTSMVTLSVMMQDPLVSATLTDTVMLHLQNYITEYRTNKARHDMAFTQQLFDEAQQKYFESQQRYARYLDANQNIVLRSVRTEQERLQNEMNLNYQIYTQMAQQLQLAKAKVQESTPVYAVVQPATVPIKASKPSKFVILVGFVFLAGVAACGWILLGRDVLKKLKE